MIKILMTIFIMILITIAACQKSVQQQPPATTQVKTITPSHPTQTTADPAVDAVEKDLSNADSVEKDLNSDNLNDSGLSEIQDI